MNSDLLIGGIEIMKWFGKGGQDGCIDTLHDAKSGIGSGYRKFSRKLQPSIKL